MNSERFCKALDGISDDLIDAAADVYDKKKKQKRIVFPYVRVACAALVLTALLFGLFGLPGGDPEIITAPGILKVYAYDLENADGTDVSELEGIELQEGVEFPSNIGWGVPFNTYPGLPVTLSVPEEYFADRQIEFRITVDGGEFFRKFTLETGFYWWGKAYLGQKFTLENNQTIFWHSIETDQESVGKEWDMTITEPDVQGEMGPKLVLFEGDRAFVEVLILADENIVGTTLIEIYKDETRPLWYLAKVVKSVYYPQIDGKYQNISEDYALKQLEDWKMK